MRTIIESHVLDDGLRETDRLHSAQGFVVDRNCPRRVYRAFVPFDQHDPNAGLSEKVRHCQPSRASADHGDVVISRTHSKPAPTEIAILVRRAPRSESWQGMQGGQ